MRLLLCMSHTCPWSHSIASGLQALGHDVFGFDFSSPKEGGFVSNDNAGLQADIQRYRRTLSGFFLHPSATRSNARYILGVPAFRRLTQSLKPDVLLSLGGTGYGLMMYLSGVRPYAVYVVGSEVLLASAANRRVNRRVLAAASAVFANGEYLAGKAREQSPGAPIEPLLIGVDVGALPVASFVTRPVQIVCNRGFAHVYNNEAIVRALALLPANLADCRVVFVSGGMRLAETIALADRILPPESRARVQFLGGVSYPEVLRVVSSSQIFLSMSRSDGTATSLLEAMACGLFPIVSDIPQNRPFVSRDEVNGLLVPLDDDRALAEAITRAVSDPDWCGRQAAGNRAMVARLADAGRSRLVLAERLESIAGSLGRRRTA